MKNCLVLLGLLLILTSFVNNQFKIKEKAPETKFLREVESAVITHDADKLMTYMERDYKRSQHDEFLEGRTVQFLNEFFGSTIPFNDIISAELTSYSLQKGSKTDYDIFFHLKSDTTETDCQFFMRKNANTNTFALYGVVG